MSNGDAYHDFNHLNRPFQNESGEVIAIVKIIRIFQIPSSGWCGFLLDDTIAPKNEITA